MSMPIRLRSLLVALGGLALILAGLYSAYWFHAAGELRKGIDAFAAARRAEGWRVEMAEPATFGFPAQIGLDLGEVRLRGPAGLDWRSNRVRVRLPGFDPLGPVLDLGGQHELAFGQAWRGIVTATAVTLRLRVDTDGDLHAFAFEAVAPVLEQPGADPVAARSLAITYDWLNPPDPGHEKPSARFTAGATGLDLAALDGSPLSRTVETAQVEGRIMGTIPETTPLAALAAWSSDGGTVELDRLAVEWGPLSLDGDGTFAFDPALQPLVATTAHIRGWKEFMVRLVQARLIEPGMASAAEIMLAILARPDAQGRPTLTLALSLQDGFLYAGQAKLLRVPPLPIPVPGSRPAGN